MGDNGGRSFLEDEEELNIMRERLNVFVDSLPRSAVRDFILACIEGLKYMKQQKDWMSLLGLIRSKRKLKKCL